MRTRLGRSLSGLGITPKKARVATERLFVERQWSERQGHRAKAGQQRDGLIEHRARRFGAIRACCLFCVLGHHCAISGQPVDEAT
ncbi:hypothetical protein CEP88_15825 [Roseobacter denitrificans]|nr:hypothetical protein CEP88_15825 [Roseobacter denitrificans]